MLVRSEFSQFLLYNNYVLDTTVMCMSFLGVYIYTKITHSPLVEAEILITYSDHWYLFEFSKLLVTVYITYRYQG